MRCNTSGKNHTCFHPSSDARPASESFPGASSIDASLSGGCPDCPSMSNRQEIRQMALSLQAEQVSLTQKQIGRPLAQPAILRDPNGRELLREVCHERETSNTTHQQGRGQIH